MENQDDFQILNINDSLYVTRLSGKFLKRKLYSPPDPKTVISSIPGTVLDILVKKGQVIGKGDDLMILDSMKMQNRLKSTAEGKIKRIPVSKGDKVSKGTVLLMFE
ncbi:MAG: acetyl-CoA carboxylase biotin carboxyl carrier protein subunit [Bacteroidales bacterium]|jgi:biotin carboxyl carrier protein|nr:acetyl-CoA carboxylase biotin carboxyl carrier protein subunit [Bacteroidales bacterium]